MWQEFFGYPHGPEGCPQACSDVARRSSWHKTSLKQLLAGCREYQWQPGQDLVEKIRSRARLASGSLLVEETIGDMKNRSIPRQTQLFRKPETCYYLSLRKGSLEARTKYTTPPLDVPLQTKMSKLPLQAFEACAAKRSIPFDKIVSTVQKTTWYSPGAPNLTVRDVDHHMLRDLKKLDPVNPPWPLMKHAWLGKLCATEHLVCFRVGGLDDPDVWLLGLGCFHGSATMGWPGRLVEADGHKYFDFDMDVDALVFRLVADVRRVQAVKLA